jgi:hypothetical protein
VVWLLGDILFKRDLIDCYDGTVIEEICDAIEVIKDREGAAVALNSICVAMTMVVDEFEVIATKEYAFDFVAY